MRFHLCPTYREKRLANSRKHYELGKHRREREREKSRRYRAENADHVRAYERQYRRVTRHPDQYLAKVFADSGEITAQEVSDEIGRMTDGLLGTT